MYLAYLDDSDTKNKASKWQVMSAVIVKDSRFAVLEIIMGVLAEILVTAEKIDLFTEFHACELYGGHGVFGGIEQAKRFTVIQKLLESLKDEDLPIVYGAVDLLSLGKMVYGSADPLDIAFRICAEGVDQWIGKKVEERFQYFQTHKEEFGNKENATQGFLSENMGLLIADDCDGKSKAAIQRSFRNMRKNRRKKDWTLKHLHDDMYFGDSKYSIGIQLADLCSYFIARHLDGDVATDGFYKLIEPQIVYSQIEPKQEKHDE